MDVHILTGARTALLNKKAQLNFGFIIALLILVGLIISVTTGILDLLPSIKHEAETAALEPRASVVSKLLLEDPGYPADWSAATVQRVGLLHYDSYKNKSVLGRLNSTKLDHVGTLSYDAVAHQIGLMNETSFRLRVMNGSTILDINSSRPGGTSSVYTMRRIFAIDNTGFGNVTLEVWE